MMTNTYGALFDPRDTIIPRSRALGITEKAKQFDEKRNGAEAEKHANHYIPI